MIDKLYPTVERLLDWTAKRQQTLSANITNYDTPGYRARDVAFEEHLQSLRLSATNEAHLKPVTETASARIYEAGTEVKRNGNSVDLEHEMTEIAKNGLQYITLVQYLNHKLRTLRSAINDGGRA